MADTPNQPLEPTASGCNIQFMRLAGPLTDNAGGAVLLEVSDEAEAKAIVANDPAVKSGIFVYEIHPWKLQPWEEFAKKAKGATQ